MIADKEGYNTYEMKIVYVTYFRKPRFGFPDCRLSFSGEYSFRRRFERMIEIGMIPTPGKPKADEPIDRRQKHSPAFILANMNQFMASTSFEAPRVPRENDVS